MPSSLVSACRDSHACAQPNAYVAARQVDGSSLFLPQSGVSRDLGEVDETSRQGRRKIAARLKYCTVSVCCSRSRASVPGGLLQPCAAEQIQSLFYALCGLSDRESVTGVTGESSCGKRNSRRSCTPHDKARFMTKKDEPRLDRTRCRKAARQVCQGGEYCRHGGLPRGRSRKRRTGPKNASITERLPLPDRSYSM